jgi:hypothetical protein
LYVNTSKALPLKLMVSVDELDDFIANTLALLRRDPCQVVRTSQIAL